MSYIGNNLQDQSKDCYIEKTTAYQGQTAFTLQRAYTPGTNSLKVYVNGVRQSSVNFTEVDNHTVTFNGSLASGDDVLFEIDNLVQQVSAQAANIPYSLPSGAYTNVSAALDGVYGINQTFRNLLMNGSGQINQRGAVITVGGYFVDRWTATCAVASAAFQAFQVSSSDCSRYTDHHFALQTTTTKASLTAGEWSALWQKIEGTRIEHLKFGTAAAKPLVLTFRAKSNTGSNFVMGIAVRNSGGTRSYVTSVTLTSTPKSYTVFIPGDTSGTWTIDTNAGMSVAFIFASSSTFTTATTESWVTGNYLAPTNQTNGLATNLEAISLADVQLEVGTEPTPFEVLPFPVELAMCQRYYEKSFPYATVPAQNAGHAGSSQGVAGRATTGQQYINFIYKVSKRATPTTITLYNPAAANNQPLDQSSGTSCSSASVLMSGENGATIICNGSASTAVGALLSVNWTADAEL